MVYWCFIRQIINYDFEGFFESQIEERRQFNYPPFSHLIKIVFKHKDYGQTLFVAGKVADYLRKVFGEERVYGPVPPVVSKIKNKFYFELVIKVEKNITKAISLIRAGMEKFKEADVLKSVEWYADVDAH